MKLKEVKWREEALDPSALKQQMTDRAFWDHLPKQMRQHLIQAGEECLRFAYPPIRATDFMEIVRTGNRQIFETPYFSRRVALEKLVFAECAEHEGRFLNDIINGIYCICEETCWHLSAHNFRVRDSQPGILPDPASPIIDLFAAETGALLAMTGTLLKEQLNEISPLILNNITCQLRRRIIQPYLQEYFYWMGDGKCLINNWTPWCTANMLLTLFFAEDVSREEQEAGIHKALQSLDYFLDVYGEDGGCNEGSSYYSHAAGKLFQDLWILNAVTGNAFAAAWKDSKIRNMAAYIYHAHISDCWYVNFADGDARPGRRGATEYLFAKMTEQPDMMAFAALDFQKSVSERGLDLTGGIYNNHLNNPLKVFLGIAYYEEMMNFRGEAPAPADVYYEIAGQWIARDSRFTIAVKSGCNADSHNHNDVGHFIVFRDGRPMFIDAGVQTYTLKTFTDRRYEIWTMQSRYHNLPTFGPDESFGASGDIGMSPSGLQQQAGAVYRAEDVRASLTPETASISMELAAAYNDPRVSSYRRSVVLEKGRQLTITDRYQGSAQPAVLTLMTWEKPVWDGRRLTVGSAGSCLISGAEDLRTERISIEDSRMSKTWGNAIYRTLVTITGEEISLVIPE